MMAAGEQMPRRKGQAIQIIDCRTRKYSRRNFSGRDSHGRLFWFPFDEEVGMSLQEFRHMSRGRSKESHSNIGIMPLGVLHPLDFVFVINQRTEDKSDVALNQFFSGNSDIVSGFFENRRQICGMNAGHILEEFSGAFDPARRPRKTAKSRTVPSNNRILIHKTAASL